jgi:hypothetical protein
MRGAVQKRRKRERERERAGERGRIIERAIE